MRKRLSTVLAAALLLLLGAAPPARADVLQASSTTLAWSGALYRDGEAKSALPVYELVSLSASEMRNSWGEFEAALSAWSAVDGGGIRFWQNGGAAGSRASGDVDVGYLRGDVLAGRLTFRLGRQMVAEGGARMIHLDGAQAVLHLPQGLGLSAWGGALVAPRFDARGGELAVQGTRAKSAYGGRVSWSRPGQIDLGASATLASDGSEVSRQEVGADLRLTPAHGVEVTGAGFYSLYDKRPGQIEAAVRFGAGKTLSAFADFQHVEPNLFLPRDSILAVFASDKRDDVGGGLRWTPRRAVTVDADFHFLKESEGNGSRSRVKGTLSPYLQGTVGAELQILKVADNGYLGARVFGSREHRLLSRTVDASVDLWFYKYDKKVNDYSQSVGATAAGGLQLAPGWKAVIAATFGSDPLFKARTEIMAKLVWNQLFVREVR